MSALAEKIAAVVGTPVPLAMNLTNSSSIGSGDVSSVYDGLLAALRVRHFGIVSPEPPGGPDTRVQVTLSENASSYIWAAEVWMPGAADRQVAIVSAAKLADRSAGHASISISLARRLLWTQPEKILDFALISSPDAPDRLVVLGADRVAFYDFGGGQWQLTGAVPVVHSGALPRDLMGAIDPATGKVKIEGALCDGDVSHPGALRCEVPRRTGGPPLPENMRRVEIAERSDVTSVGAPCAGLGTILLTSGAGDWTELDDLRAYEAAGGLPQPVGQPYEMSGPVFALGAGSDGKSARVVSRNLQTGMYEASIISISCGN